MCRFVSDVAPAGCRLSPSYFCQAAFFISSQPSCITQNASLRAPALHHTAITSSNLFPVHKPLSYFFSSSAPFFFLAALFEFKIEAPGQVGSLPRLPLIASSQIHFLSDCNPQARSGGGYLLFLICGTFPAVMPLQAAPCSRSERLIHSSSVQPFCTFICFSPHLVIL